MFGFSKKPSAPKKFNVFYGDKAKQHFHFYEEVSRHLAIVRRGVISKSATLAKLSRASNGQERP